MNKKPLGSEHIEERARLAALPEDQVDTGDIPEAPVENWIHARRGALYRPVKQPGTIRSEAKKRRT